MAEAKSSVDMQHLEMEAMHTENPWNRLEHMLSQESLEQRARDLNEQIIYDPHLRVIRGVRAQLEALYARYEQEGSLSLITEIDAVNTRLHEELQEDNTRLHLLETEQYEATQGIIHASSDDPLVRFSVSPDIDNQPRAIIHPGVPPDDEQHVLTQLQALPFMHEASLGARMLPGTVVVRAEAEPIHIPADELLGAHNLESWAGRGAYNKKDGRPSTAVVLDYASRPTDIPPLEYVVCYIQPNGRRIFMAPSSAHRAAAQKARGAPTIGVREIAFHRLRENLLP